MRIAPTSSQLAASESLTSAVLAKVIPEIRFEQEAFSHAQIQYCFDNDIEITETLLYSPVLTQAQTEASVPTNWPDSRVNEGTEEEPVWRQKTYAEYTRIVEVTGGFVAVFTGGAKDSNDNIKYPTWSQMKVWYNQAGGFLTQAEVDEIKVVEEIIE